MPGNAQVTHIAVVLFSQRHHVGRKWECHRTTMQPAPEQHSRTNTPYPMTCNVNKANDPGNKTLNPRLVKQPTQNKRAPASY